MNINPSLSVELFRSLELILYRGLDKEKNVMQIVEDIVNHLDTEYVFEARGR